MTWKHACLKPQSHSSGFINRIDSKGSLALESRPYTSLPIKDPHLEATKLRHLHICSYGQRRCLVHGSRFAMYFGQLFTDLTRKAALSKQAVQEKKSRKQLRCSWGPNPRNYLRRTGLEFKGHNCTGISCEASISAFWLVQTRGVWPGMMWRRQDWRVQPTTIFSLM